MDKEQIKAKRLQLGMSQPQFAKYLGVGIASVSRWELGISKPSNMAIEKLEGIGEVVPNAKI